MCETLVTTPPAAAGHVRRPTWRVCGRWRAGPLGPGPEPGRTESEGTDHGTADTRVATRPGGGRGGPRSETASRRAPGRATGSTRASKTSTVHRTYTATCHCRPNGDGCDEHVIRHASNEWTERRTRIPHSATSVRVQTPVESYGDERFLLLVICPATPAAAPGCPACSCPIASEERMATRLAYASTSSRK